MARTLRQSWRRLPRLEVILTLAGLLAASLWVSRDAELQRPAPLDVTERAPAPRESTEGDVLVLLPVVPSTQSVEHLSTDQIWLNAVEREVGRARSVEASAFSQGHLHGVAWVIVPRRASAQLEPAQIQTLHTWLSAGGILLLEQPEGPWRALLGTLPVSSARRPTRHVTSFDGSVSRGPVRDDLLEMPVRTSIIPWSPEDSVRGRDYDVLMEVDGLPALVSMRRDEGMLYMLLIDVSRAIANLTQGLHGADFLLDLPMDAEGLPIGPPRAHQLVAEPLRRAVMVPYVDLLVRNLLLLPDQHRPIARLWAYPGLSRGALLVTRSAWGHPELTLELAQEDHGRGWSTTYFLREDLFSPERLHRLARRGQSIELGGSWPDGQGIHPGPSRTQDLAGRALTRRPASLGEQTDALNQRLHPYPPVLAHRNVDGLWTHDVMDTWSRLQATGFLLDLTLGGDAGLFEGSRELFGYTHGTGHAWRPIDRSGHRFRLYALPVHSVDRSAAYTWPRLRRLLLESSERYHTTVVTDWRVDTLVEAPAWDAIEGWQQVRALATTQDLWVTTVGEYSTFLFRRLASGVSSTWDPEERKLSIHAQLRVSERAQHAEDIRTPALSFPARFEGRPVDRLEVNGVPEDLSVLALTGDRALHLLETTPGEHRIDVWWGVTATEEEREAPARTP